MQDSTNKSCHIKFLPAGQDVEITPGITVMEAAQKAGIYLDNMCGNEGLCGKCRVRIVEGMTVSKADTPLNEDDLADGIVLACQAVVSSDITVEIPASSLLDTDSLNKDSKSEALGAAQGNDSAFPFDPLCHKVYLELPIPNLVDNSSDISRIEIALEQMGFTEMVFHLDIVRRTPVILRDAGFKTTVTLANFGSVTDILDIEGGDTSSRNYGLAVDIGTTTIAAILLDLDSDTILGRATDYNSQIRYGPDVIARIMHAQESENGVEELKDAVVSDIGKLAQTLVTDAGLTTDDINCIVCAGNTTMNHMLHGIPPDTIRREPYIPVITKHRAFVASKLGLEIADRGMIETLPSVGAYVGSDITAGVLFSGMSDNESLSMLIDIGTNGEIVLGNSDLLICCSASAGPAFEGAGTKCGMRAAKGAIESVSISETGEISLDIIGGDVPPVGICGSGFISLVAELSAREIIDRSGRFNKDNKDDRIRNNNDGEEFLIHENTSSDGSDVVVTEADIASFIRTKGAIYTAAEALLWHVGFSWSDVSDIYISGAFGNHMDIRKSINVGLLPDLPIEKFNFIGNGSLAGAKMCLRSRDALKKAKKIADSMTYFDLSTDSRFMNEFTASLFLPHTDVEKFPSVT